MNIIILILIFLVLIIAVTLAKKLFKTSVEIKTLPYKKKEYLLSVAEKEFYQVLSMIAERNNFLLFAKVRLEDLLWIPKNTNNRGGLRNRIKSRHVDFVLCNKADIRPLLVIELDDSSHEREDRISRDEFVNHVLHDAGLPILHQKFQHFYDSEAIRAEIFKLIEN